MELSIRKLRNRVGKNMEGGLSLIIMQNKRETLMVVSRKTKGINTNLTIQ
jgi:hypothetical protein